MGIKHDYTKAYGIKPSPGETRRSWFLRISNETGINFRSIIRAWSDFKETYNYSFDEKSDVVDQPKEATPRELLEMDRAMTSLKKTRDSYKGKYEEALKIISDLEGVSSVVSDIKSNHKECYTVSFPNRDGADVKIPLIQWSDFHFEEKVDGSVVSDLNTYNVEIAKDRFSKKLIPNIISYINDIKSNSVVDTIYICLNGDMISGYIHDDLREDNYLSPTEAIIECRKMIIAGLLELKDKLSLKKIIVQGNYGNHGRSTKDKRHSTAYKNSYEWLMLNDIAERLESDSTFEFSVSKGIFSYYTFKNDLGSKFTIRSWHGDNIKYNGGVGGITVPLNRMLFKLDQTKYADYNFIGHFHQLFEAHKKVLVNGSLIGYNSFAHNLGFEYEDPQQGMVVLNINEMRVESKFNILCK